MQIGAITGYIDVAQLVLYVFWGFFAGLIIYLHKEDKREGYPLLTGQSRGRTHAIGFPDMPTPKVFLTHGGPVMAPRAEPPQVLNARPTAPWYGAPFEPTGDPMLAGMGPGAWAQNRADEPDLTFDDNLPKIVPLRSVPEYFLAWEDPQIIGMTVYGCDGALAGVVKDAWVDRSEVVIRYIDVELSNAPRTVLMPMNFLSIKGRRREVHTNFITAAQFATIPALRNPDIITLLEEEKITAYFGGGSFYAIPGRQEALI